MENKRFLTAQDVMEMLDVSLSYAYKLIRRLNAELEADGFVTIKGRVSTQYFMKRIYGLCVPVMGIWTLQYPGTAKGSMNRS